MKPNFEDECRFNDQILREKDILETKLKASDLLAERLAIQLAKNPTILAQ